MALDHSRQRHPYHSHRTCHLFYSTQQSTDCQVPHGSDKKILVLLRETQVGQTKSAQQIHWPDVKQAMLDWKVYAFGPTQFANNVMSSSFSIFLPTIIRRIGDWSVAEVQLLTVPVYRLGAITYIVCSRRSDITQIRGPVLSQPGSAHLHD
jgi:hypothetical protein